MTLVTRAAKLSKMRRTTLVAKLRKFDMQPSNGLTLS
ncbi:hypothetical protein MNBD_GAMMA26-602 [hydrothermal vent metagenome]|uniref:Uncharacterized protein n=1 Tax=hydrothermal vent metagenome TaxID=652676 RepID=A0A3B1B331_9ZZZZ